MLEYGVSVYGPKAGMYVTGGRVLARVPGLGSLAHHNPYRKTPYLAPCGPRRLAPRTRMMGRHLEDDTEECYRAGPSMASM